MVSRKRTQNLHIAYCFMVLHILTTKVLNSRLLPVFNAFFVIQGLNGTLNKFIDMVRMLENIELFKEYGQKTLS